MQVRKLTAEEVNFLEEMLFEALFVPEGQEPFPKSILKNPSISRYIENWEKKSFDLALVAELQGKKVGAIWGRIFKFPNTGYGFVDENTPEITIAVRNDYRNQGIGQMLINELSAQYLLLGIRAISLSVDKRNRAIHLYQRLGFAVVNEDGTAVTMKKMLI